MLSTDVVSYFEYVEIGILIQDLLGLKGTDGQVVGLLSVFLNELQRSTDIWGIPQGPDASAILGNFYLRPVDRVLELNKSVVGLRFQDDLMVFAKDASLS